MLEIRIPARRVARGVKIYSPSRKALGQARQGFRAAQRGFTVGSRIHSVPTRATLSANSYPRKFRNPIFVRVERILRIRWGEGNMILLLWSVTISLTVTTSECGIKSDFWSARNGRLSIRIYPRLNRLKDISSQMVGLC